VGELAEFQVEMSDDEWRTVRGPLDLPESDRSRIGQLVGFYLFLVDERRDKPNAKTREQIEKAYHAAGALRERLNAFDQRTIETLICGLWDSSKVDALNAEDGARLLLGPGARRYVRESLAQALQTLKRLSDGVALLEVWLGSRASGIERRPTRSRQNLEWLVEALDGIARERGTPISRSYKSRSRDFIVSVASIADPGIGQGSVDEAMKAVIKKRANWDVPPR
jgi:hypothetical protein